MTVAKCPRIDPVVCRHGRLNLVWINGRKPASRWYFVLVPGQSNSGPDLLDKIQAPQQPSLTGVAKWIFRWLSQPALDITTVRRFSIAATDISLPGSIDKVVGYPIDTCRLEAYPG